MRRKDDIAASRIELDAAGKLWMENDPVGKISFESFRAEQEFRDWLIQLEKARRSAD